MTKAAERFGCERVTFVADRGMIKSEREEDLAKAGFHSIMAITKPQIRAMIKNVVFQIGLFENRSWELLDGGVRYVFRHNPQRAPNGLLPPVEAGSVAGFGR